MIGNVMQVYYINDKNNFAKHALFINLENTPSSYFKDIMGRRYKSDVKTVTTIRQVHYD